MTSRRPRRVRHWPARCGLAGFGPLGAGLIHAATGDWTAVLIALAVSGVVMTIAGLKVSGRVVVDDELAGP